MFDLVTVGEAMLRLWVPAGERLEDAPAFRVAVGGAEANVAIAASRAGLSVAWLSRLPDSTIGRRVAREMRGHGVDVSHVQWDAEARLGVYFVELTVPPRPISVLYDRAESAASAMKPDDIPWEVVESARAVHMTGITAALSPSAHATAFAVAEHARSAGVPLVVDVNYRRKLWTEQEAAQTMAELARLASVLITTAEDSRDLFGLTGPAESVAAELRQSTGAGAVVVTRGAAGAAWDSGDGSGSHPGHLVETIDRIGAGDAFAAGVAMGVLNGDLGEGVRTGLAMAAVKMGIAGDHLVASADEIDGVLNATDEREVGR